MDVVMYNYVVV